MATTYEDKAVLSQISLLKSQIKKREYKVSYYTWAMKVEVLYKLLHEVGNDNEAIKYAELLIKESNKDKLNNLTPKKQVQAVDILREAYFYLGSQGKFHYFLLGMEFDRPLKDRFYQPRMKQLRETVEALQMLHDRELNFLVIEMPPRTGKTTLGLLFLTMCMGEEPNRSSLGISYASTVASSFYDGVMEFMTDETYNFKHIFPKATVAQSDTKEMFIDLQDKRRYKTMTFRSIDGQITGGVEANNILYLDDLIQNIEEAKNKDRLDKAWDKVSVDIFQRRKPEQGCVTLAIGTNWSIDDPLTKLINLNADNPKARVVKMPALDPLTDNSNFDYDYGVGFSTEYYRDLRDKTFKDDPVSFSCIYQQEPMERSVLKFYREDLQRFYTLPTKKPDYVTAYCDCAFGGGDYLALAICKVWDNVNYITDVVFTPKDYKTTEPMVARALMEAKCSSCTFEANNGGEFYANDVYKLLREMKYRCSIKTKRSLGTMAKYDRIDAYAPDIMELVFKADTLLEKDTPYKQAMQALCSFSSQANPKTQKDDFPDCLAGLCSILKAPSSGRVVVYNRSQFPYL